MRTYLRITLICLLFAAILAPDACADDTTAAFELNEMEKALTEDERRVTGYISDDGKYDVGGAIERAVRNAAEKAAGKIKDELRVFVELLAIAAMCACASAVNSDTKAGKFINIAACASAAVLTVGSMDGIVNEASQALFRMEDYSHAALPVVFTAAAAGGAPASSAAGYAACCLAIDVIMRLSHEVLMPLAGCYLALSISLSVMNSAVLDALLKLTKWAVSAMLSLSVLAFTSYIALTGTVAGSTDAVAVKTAKTVISTVLPVVGGMISDAAAVVLSSAGLIKNTAGIFGLVSVLAVCAEPFVTLLIRFLLFKLCAAAADIAAGTGLSKLLDNIASAVAMLVGMVGAGAIMLFVSFTAAIKTVGGL